MAYGHQIRLSRILVDQEAGTLSDSLFLPTLTDPEMMTWLHITFVNAQRSQACVERGDLGQAAYWADLALQTCRGPSRGTAWAAAHLADAIWRLFVDDAGAEDAFHRVIATGDTNHAAFAHGYLHVARSPHAIPPTPLTRGDSLWTRFFAVAEAPVVAETPAGRRIYRDPSSSSSSNRKPNT